MRWRTISWIALALLVVPFVLTTLGSAHAADNKPAPAMRKGRPRPQITYKGTSPYFNVDFDRYTGKITCVWCHQKTVAIWEKEESFHSKAYDVLDEKARKNPDCVKCHVTAFNRNGVYPMDVDETKQKARKMGYTLGGDPKVNALFLGVQCEACHGPNCGNKLSLEDLEDACRKCHNKEYSGFKGFDVKAAMAKMKHAAIGADEHVKFDAYMGVDSCFMCHWPNYQAWKKEQGPHVRAYADLDAAGRKNPACLKCHTTGFNQDGEYPLEEPANRTTRRGGYTFGGSSSTNSRFLGVQCEACHGINCGTYVTKERIEKQCVECHSGKCVHDKGFSFERDYAKVKHRPPPSYTDTGKHRVEIEWDDFEEGLATAKAFEMPILVLFSNPPEG